MSEQPLISIIIPVYNPGEHLEKCLKSITQQTYKNLEIILIDDGSTDHSKDICKRYAKIDNRIIFRSQENKGVSSARNYGIKLASGDFYSFIDSDDWIELDTYEYLIDKMKKQQTDAISFEYFISYEADEVVHKLKDSQYGRFDTGRTISEHMIFGNNFLCTKLLPKYSIEDLWFDEEIFRGEDTLFGWKALSRIEYVYFDSRPLLHYVQSEESACRGEFRINQLTAMKLVPIETEFLKSNYPELLNPWRCNFLHLIITLYYDMFADSKDYSKEMRNLNNEYLKIYKQMNDKSHLTVKENIKFLIFKINPLVYCILHKRIHKL